MRQYIFLLLPLIVLFVLLMGSSSSQYDNDEDNSQFDDNDKDDSDEEIFYTRHPYLLDTFVNSLTDQVAGVCPIECPSFDEARQSCVDIAIPHTYQNLPLCTNSSKINARHPYRNNVFFMCINDLSFRFVCDVGFCIDPITERCEKVCTESEYNANTCINCCYP